MPAEDRFGKRYESGDTPWDIGKADINLIETVTTRAIEPCRALDEVFLFKSKSASSFR